MPEAEQEQRAKWDLLLADIERRHEQLRLARGVPWWSVICISMAIGAGLFAAGAAFCKLMQ